MSFGASVNARPVDAEAWVWLGWSEASKGRREQGATLASYGASPDPRRKALALAAERITP
jgi:hypothetical protein